MKVIDEKGKLFGKINVIDFMVILFFLGFIPVLYFGSKIISVRPSIEEEKEFIEIDVNCKFSKIKPNVLKLIKIGDKETDYKGVTIGEIIWLGEIAPYVHNLDLVSGHYITQEEGELKEMAVKLKIKAAIKGNALYYKYSQILFNSPIIFKTDKYELEFVPKEEKVIEETGKINLHVILKKIDENILKLITVGDKELNEEREVIAEILDIGKIENNLYEINLGDGNFMIGEDINKKQVSVKMCIKAEIGKNKELYFKDRLVLVDRWIEFKTDKYTVIGKVSKTYEYIPEVFKEKWLKVQVKFSAIIPELATLLVEGDIDKEPVNKIVARLLKVVSNKPSETLVLQTNTFVTIAHPFYKDIIGNLDFLCTEKDGILYFKNYPVKIGNPITFTTELYSITGTIIGIKSE